MEKLLCVVFVWSLLVATLAEDAAAASSLHPSQLVDRQQARALGRKGREGDEVDLLGGYRHYRRREGERKKQHHEVEALEVKKKKKGGLRGEDAAKEEGLIYSADYSGVAMHARSPAPAHKHHPKP